MHASRKTLALLAAALVAAAALAFGLETAAKRPSAGVYWGALIDGQAYGVGDPPFDMRAVDIFEAHAGKKISILRWGQPWSLNGKFVAFQTAQYEKLRRRGVIPLIDWWSQDLGGGAEQPEFRSRAVASGAYDAYIRQWARDARAWGHPFFLSLNPEMNGWWYPWAEGRATASGPIVNGNAPGDYVKMWRHVHDIFNAEGATNVTWVWHVNIIARNDQYAPLASLYPGDGYVDWVGLSVYNKNPQSLTFEQLVTGKDVPWLDDSYAQLVAVAPTKPILVDFGSNEYGDGPAVKTAWIQDVLQNQLPRSFPRVKAALWFNWNDRDPANTLPIESSTEAQSAFARAIASSYYADNDFEDLDEAPIPPP